LSLSQTQVQYTVPFDNAYGLKEADVLANVRTTEERR